MGLITESRDEAEELVELEKRRCAAMAQRDWAFLDEVLADEFTYTHTQGHTEDKAQHLSALKGRDRAVERTSTRATLYGDTAVVTGQAHFVMMEERTPGKDDEPPVPLRESDHILLEVWVKRANRWQLVAIQGTRTNVSH